MDKLIQMTDFVLELERDPHYYESQIDFYDGESHDKFKIIRYAKFLRQTLTLGMFVPCDEDGNVLSEPKWFNKWYKWGVSSKLEHSEIIKCQEFWKAKEKVLIKGFNEDSARKLMYYNDNIEQLANYNLYELTPSALKAIGIE